MSVLSVVRTAAWLSMATEAISHWCSVSRATAASGPTRSKRSGCALPPPRVGELPAAGRLPSLAGFPGAVEGLGESGEDLRPADGGVGAALDARADDHRDGGAGSRRDLVEYPGEPWPGRWNSWSSASPKNRCMSWKCCCDRSASRSRTAASKPATASRNRSLPLFPKIMRGDYRGPGKPNGAGSTSPGPARPPIGERSSGATASPPSGWPSATPCSCS